MFNFYPVPAFHTPKPTLSALYEEDSTLFAGMEYPEGIGAEDVASLLLLRLGTLETIFTTAAEAKAAFTLWASIQGAPWAKMWEALQEQYQPLENYSMLEQMTGDETIKAYGKSTTRTPNLTNTETPNETRGSSAGVYGFNSSDAVPDSTGSESRTGTNTVTETGTETVADSGRDVETRNYQLTRSGNIGVTTSQQMLESEMELRTKWNMYEVICAGFRREFCVAVW